MGNLITLDNLPIAIAYLLVIAECVGQVFLKKFFKKDRQIQKTFIIGKTDEVHKIKQELLREREEWQKEKAEMRQIIAAQAEQINKIEKALKVYTRRSNKDSPS